MNPPPLWRASVPVFQAVLDRMAATLHRGEAVLGRDGLAAALARPPAPGMMPAARQVATAAQFTLRIACALAGQRVAELDAGLDLPGLHDRLARSRAHLASLDPAAFTDRTCRDTAGFARIALPSDAFLHAFGLPNLYFHQAMAHVALKQGGVPLGKADFDGLHDYPQGFSLG